MNKKGLLKYLLLILAVFVLIGCQDPENPIEETTPSLYLTTDTIVLYAGDERKLEYFVEDIEEYEISIEVEDEEIAKVEGETVYGVTGGETKIKIKIVGYDETEQEVTVRVLGGGPVSTQIMEWVKAEIGYEQLEGFYNEAKSLGFDIPENFCREGIWEREDHYVIVVPAHVVPHPVSTVGMGDTISSSSYASEFSGVCVEN